MPSPLGSVPEEIVDGADAVRRGEFEASEEDLVATFKQARQPGVQNRVLAALARRRRGGQR